MKRLSCLSSTKSICPITKRSRSCVVLNQCNDTSSKECINRRGNKDASSENCKLHSKDYDAQTAEKRSLTINDLPPSVLLQILSNLGIRELLCCAALVCKRWKTLSLDPDLWREIDFDGILKVSDQVLVKYTSINCRLRELDLRDLRLITSTTVQETLARCTHLRKLCLNRCMFICDSDLVGIRHCSQLTELKLNCCVALSDRTLKAIAVACTQLQLLFISQCPNLTDDGLVAVAQNCPELRHLACEQNPRIGNESLTALAKHCVKLEVLRFMGNDFTTSGIMVLQKCKELIDLEVSQTCAMTDDVIRVLVQNCTKLQSLNMALCSHVTDNGVELIAKHANNIDKLYLVACRITDKALMSLAKHHTRITRLDVGWCEAVTLDGVQAVVTGCDALVYLGLMRCDRLTPEDSNMLESRYPHIQFSTKWIEYNKLWRKVEQSGSSQ